MKIRLLHVMVVTFGGFSRTLDMKINKQIIRLQKNELEERGYKFDDKWYEKTLSK